MVASVSNPLQRPAARPARRRNPGQRGGSESLRIIQGSMSARRIERQAPWLAGLHRVSTGALVGLGLSMTGLSALTLHWQNHWADSYARLQAAKVLTHRLQESTALLEQHHLGIARRPGQLVPTSSENLIHLREPQAKVQASPLALLANLPLRPMPAGY
ncbi:MAG: hypothetical protein VKK62_11330 [Synechococcaceae cyanobacterium]|nr:hypothetical protein [Synechococcaceae cyanobacterium]